MKKLILTALTLVSVNLMYAQSAEQKGLEIAKAAEAADEGFGSSTVELKMTLKNKNGQTSERSLTTRTLELTEDGDKSLIVFGSPKDVKGTATLTFTHKTTADDQWLFLP
ncbi:MAG: outer membrane lipoprotein-sorting protein [Flavobacteriales bacterium]|nr:outer membrane lipoprotein-sorting protein [Flavobacteriales bacterium]